MSRALRNVISIIIDKKTGRQKKFFFLVPKMFQLFLPNFGGLTSKLQSVFLYRV